MTKNRNRKRPLCLSVCAAELIALDICDMIQLRLEEQARRFCAIAVQPTPLILTLVLSHGCDRWGSCRNVE